MLLTRSVRFFDSVHGVVVSQADRPRLWGGRLCESEGRALAEMISRKGYSSGARHMYCHWTTSGFSQEDGSQHQARTEEG